jgi:hypothetical protein
MGLFSRKRRQQAIEPEPPNVPDDWKDPDIWAEWDAPCNWIAGESKYPQAFAALAGEPREAGYLIPVNVVLEREPRNQYDRNAIVATADGHKIGYIGRDVAGVLAPALDGAGVTRLCVCGIVRGGYTRRKNFGVHIWLDKHPQPSVHIDLLTDGIGQVGNWPPDDDELEGATLPA